MHLSSWLVNLVYLVAALLFTFGIKSLSSPKTARLGNAAGAFGMLLAIVVTLLDREIVGLPLVLIALAVGSALGAALAVFVKMTAMPQMVGILNGFGGAASALVAGSEIFKARGTGDASTLVWSISVALSGIVGWVTFTGSLAAAGKLQEWVPGRPVVYPLQKTINLLVALAMVALGVLLAVKPLDPAWYVALSGAAGVLGVLLVLPIGGADMPVVICLLNSYSGIAAAMTGFVLGNNGLIVTGALVGASGIILTRIMCKAMNRSIWNVCFGAFGRAAPAAAGAAAGGGPGDGQPTVRGYTADDAAAVFDAARLVIVVPGYGMAVAQAQHAVRELAEVLAKRGITVKYAIHPVAGRMPGHMNVLLAEANVPYDQLFDMDAINPEFGEADVALVVGANDVTNPDARSNAASPLYGMPILDVDRARTIMIVKRSLRPGFAGIDNPLFLNPKTMMLFGDAKDVATKLTAALKRG